MLVLVVLLFSCSKQDKESSTTLHSKKVLEDSAMAVLQRNMAAVDFERLDWTKAATVYNDETPYVLEIPDVRDSTQYLVFAYQGSKPIYHWVKFALIKNDFDLLQGHLILTDVNNRVFKDYEVEPGGFVKPEVRTESHAPPTYVELDPVVVHSTYPGYDFRSLYWAFNQNPSYSGQYSGIAYPSSMYSSSGSGSGGTYVMANGTPGGPGSTVTAKLREMPGRFIVCRYKCSYSVTPLSNGNHSIYAICKDRFYTASIRFSFEINPNTLKINPTTFKTSLSGFWFGTWDLYSFTLGPVSNGTASFTFIVDQMITQPDTDAKLGTTYKFNVQYNPNKLSLTLADANSIVE